MDLFLRHALSLLHTPYLWGGENPLTGLDCSGYLKWCLRVGGYTFKEDLTAQGLHDFFQKNGTQPGYRPGSLWFFGESVNKVVHGSILLDPYRLISAAGGDPTTTTIEEAKKRGACVRIDPVRYWKEPVARIFPNYETIGVI